MRDLGVTPSSDATSPEVWAIAVLAMQSVESAQRIEIGDFVVEVTHLRAYRDRMEGLDCALGRVETMIDQNNLSLRLRDGTLQPWENATFYQVPWRKDK